jgi:thymidylate kinase
VATVPDVALIGPDGAGKTTLTQMLQSSGLLPFRYLYMGVEMSASNVALPTSRLAAWLRRRVRGAVGARRAQAHPTSAASSQRQGGRSRARATARLANRLCEEWYRQLVSWHYQLRGYVVLYDRHFLFDFSPEISPQPRSLEQRVHSWCLTHLYPRPDLVIYLDAPGAVLFARKGESTIAELERRRQGFLRQGARFPNFVQVDATRPLAEVYQDVTAHVLRLTGDQRRSRASAAE